MKCPQCQCGSSRVIDSRSAENGQIIRRRRECENCSYRFTTFERIEATPLLVIKKDGSREEFAREKIQKGIIRAAQKRQIGMDKINEIVEKVEKKVRNVGGNEISSQLIGKYAMEELIKVDDLAYIRFASVYREFEDLEAFAVELNNIIKRQKAKDKQE